MFATVLKVDSARNKFISDFMREPKHKTKWPDVKQRVAVAISMWERQGKVKKGAAVGHPFYGNQFVGGRGQLPSAAEVKHRFNKLMQTISDSHWREKLNKDFNTWANSDSNPHRGDDEASFLAYAKKNKLDPARHNALARAILGNKAAEFMRKEDMTFATVLKANPYHDKQGEFSTQSQAVFVSHGPAFGNVGTPSRGRLVSAGASMGQGTGKLMTSPAALKAGARVGAALLMGKPGLIGAKSTVSASGGSIVMRSPLMAGAVASKILTGIKSTFAAGGAAHTALMKAGVATKLVSSGASAGAISTNVKVIGVKPSLMSAKTEGWAGIFGTE